MKEPNSAFDSAAAFLKGTRLSSVSQRKELPLINPTQSKVYARLQHIELGQPEPLKSSLSASLRLRRSAVTGFGHRPMTRAQLSALLWHSCGIRTTRHGGAIRRFYPSAGALYPVEVYPLIFSVASVVPAVYHYSPQSHSLDLLLEGDAGELVVQATDDSRLRSACVVIVMTGVYGRAVQKYEFRGLRYVLFEAGHIAQNLHLVAAALGLNCYCVGGFVDADIGKLLDIEHEAEETLYMVAVGRSRRA